MKSASVEENINHTFACIKYDVGESRLHVAGWFGNVCEAGSCGSLRGKSDAPGCLCLPIQFLCLHQPAEDPRLLKAGEAKSWEGPRTLGRA
jgi:hypothetical protein